MSESDGFRSAPVPAPAGAADPSGTGCPVCSTFVGARSRCPKCGARIGKRTSLRVFRVASVILATAGLGLLYVMSRSREIPRVDIGGITRTMNFAYVRIAGEAADDARIFRRGERVESLRFTLADDTGEILVKAQGARAQALVDSDRIPRAGDRVEVAGSLNALPDSLSMWVQVPDHVRVERVEAPEVALSALNGVADGSAVRVRGTIRSLREPREGSRAPWSLEIEDAGGRATVIFFRDVFDALPDASALRAGAEVSARAVAGTYRGQRQLAVSRAPDLVFGPSAPGAAPGARVSPPPAASPEPERPLLTVGQALAEPVGQVARVAGEVQSVRWPREGSRAPWMVVLVDGLNELTIVYWSKVADALGDRTPAPGDRIEASGRLEEYRGKPQLRVERAGDLRRPEPAPRLEPAPDPPPDPAGADAEAIRPIAGLTLERTGAMAAVRGTLGAPRPIRGGAVFPLTGADGGEIDVLLWSNRVGAATIGGLRSGATVRVEGAIGDYRGRRQIVPADGAAVRAEEGAAP